MLKKIEKFTYSTAYLILASLAAIVFWSLHLEEIGVPIILGLMFLQFVLFRNAIPSVPLLLAGLFMVSRTVGNFEQIPLFLYMTPVAILAGMIVHMIRFKTRFWQGKMLPGILLMIVAMVFSSFNAAEVTIYYYFYCLIGVLYAVVYLFYRNSIDADHTEYLLKMMVLMGMVIAAEVLIYYLRVEDVLLAIQNKTITLGWGISNYIATYLVMFIPTTIYFAKKARHNAFWIVLAIFEMGMLVLTASRGGILAFAAILVPLVVFLLTNKNWKRSLVNLGITVAAIVVIVWVNYDWFVALYSRLLIQGVDDSGRFDIWKEAIATFLEHPLFGGGLFARIDGLQVYHMYHNTVLHTLATMGAVGFLGLAWQLWVQFSIFLKQKSSAMAILFIAMLGAHFHGMVDNIYYMPQFMILMLLIVCVVERSNDLLEPTLPKA